MSALQYGWNGPPETPGSFWVRFDQCTRTPSTWKEEIYAAARAITTRSTKPLWLCLSGGIDSEIMCQAFFDQGINFSVLTLAHTNGTNEHDISYARTWCRQHDVTQKIVPIDFQSFLKNDIERFIEQGYLAKHPFRYMQLKLFQIIEELGGRAVLGGGELYYELDSSTPLLAPENIYCEYNSEYVAALEWNKNNGTDHVPYFYITSPEMILAYLDLPLVACALEHPETFLHPMSKYTLKRLVYQSVWHTHTARPKYDGFEKILPIIQSKNLDLVRRLGSRMQYYRFPITRLRQELMLNNRFAYV